MSSKSLLIVAEARHLVATGDGDLEELVRRIKALDAFDRSSLRDALQIAMDAPPEHHEEVVRLIAAAFGLLAVGDQTD
jgi:hypothetical protein